MQNQVPKNWQKVKLGDVLRIKHGYAFKGEYFSDTGKYILLTPGNFSEKNGLVLKGDKEKYYVGDVPKDYILKKDDLIIAMTDLKQDAPYLGAPVFIDKDDVYLHNQRLGLIEEINKEMLDKKYLYWLFQFKDFRSKVKGSATGSTVRHTAPERIYNIGLSIPIQVFIQQKIASILSAYDDLIENNNKQIKNLEEMAQAVFKEWFALPSVALAEEGKLPKGWGIKEVKDFGLVVTGKTSSKAKSEYYGNYMPFIKTPDMHGNIFCIKTGESLSEAGTNSQKNKILPANSICVSCIGTAGIVTITTQASQTNQQINSVVLKDQIDKEFLFFALRGLENTINMYGANGATMVNLNKSKFESLQIIYPSADLVNSFHTIVYPMFELIKNLQFKNHSLYQTRDLLLPKLMSGKLRTAS